MRPSQWLRCWRRARSEEFGTCANPFWRVCGLVERPLLADLLSDLRVDRNPILPHVFAQFVAAHYFHYLRQLVRAVLPLEERLQLEDDPSEEAPKAPHVQRIVVEAVLEEDFGRLEETGGDPDVVLFAKVVELSETPVDNLELLVGMVNDDVLRLDVAVDYASGMGIVKGLCMSMHTCLQDLSHVVTNLRRSQFLGQSAEVALKGLHVLHDLQSRWT